MTECVYFIRAVGTNMVKIGYTASGIKQRISGLSTSSPFDLECLFLVPSDDPLATESQIHHDLRQYRKRGEWFEIGQDALSNFLTIRYPGHISNESEVDSIVGGAYLGSKRKNKDQYEMYIPYAFSVTTPMPSLLTNSQMSAMSYEERFEWYCQAKQYQLEQRLIRMRSRHERLMQFACNIFEHVHRCIYKAQKVYQIIKA